ncbi:hypothetical protein ACPESR_25280 [Nocardia testacea]|uniref:hypothetical protein n=1 Tax=Nocardia testacea TaxID=248551 RepID=UPI003C30704B
MFEPPEGTTDFQADADRAETAQAAAETPVAEVISPDEEIAAIERQQAKLEELRTAALARRGDNQQPQVIDSTGAAVDTTEPELPVWPHHVIEIQGKRVEVKTPSPAAIRFLAVFGSGEKRVARGDFANFMLRHVSEKSVEEIRDWTYDGEIDEHFYDELQKRIFTMGTNRPTGPSSSSPRSR